MADSIRWGILGAGGIANAFVKNLQAEGLTVAAVAARSGERARDFAERYGIPTWYEGYDGLVNDPNVDAIYVSTTHNFHLEHALLAIAAGKPVLVEKALTVTAEQARELADAARAAGVFAMEAMWTRFLPSTVLVRKLIADGAIGTVRSIQSQHHQLLNADPAGRLFNPELAGGAMLDLGVYNVSFAVDLLGVPVDIVGRGSLTQTGVDAQIASILTHPGDTCSLASCSMISLGANKAVIAGTEGYLELDGPFYNWTAVDQYSLNREEVPRRHEPHRTSRGMHFQALEVERCIREGLTESPLMTLDDSIAVMAVMDELRRQVGCVLPEDRPT